MSSPVRSFQAESLLVEVYASKEDLGWAAAGAASAAIISAIARRGAARAWHDCRGPSTHSPTKPAARNILPLVDLVHGNLRKNNDRYGRPLERLHGASA